MNGVVNIAYVLLHVVACSKFVLGKCMYVHVCNNHLGYRGIILDGS